MLGAAGEWSRFERQLRQLELDWRDVLVAGGLAEADWPSRLAAKLPAQAAGQRSDHTRTETRPAEKARSPRRDVRARGARPGLQPTLPSQSRGQADPCQPGL